MKNAGPEFGFVGSLKWQHTGERIVIAVPYNGLRTHFEKQMPKSTIATLASLQQYLQGLKDDQLESLKSEAPVFKTKVEDNSVFFTCRLASCSVRSPSAQLR